MKDRMLITSFTTWEPHQPSNAADDLLQRFIDEQGDAYSYLRHLPVDFDLAPAQVLEAFEALRPRVLVCCGMAETRSTLALESHARRGDTALQTGLDLDRLTEGLSMTEISSDAGDFVCNALYYRCLEHVQNRQGDRHCIFIHVPLLTEENAEALTEDFTKIIERLSALP